jgi:hypothetical protein
LNTAQLVPTLCVGTQAARRSALRGPLRRRRSGCEVCSHAERGNKVLRGEWEQGG